MNQRAKKQNELDDSEDLNFEESNLSDAFEARTVVVDQPSRIPPSHPNVSPTVPKHVLEAMPPVPEFGSDDGDDDNSDKTQVAPARSKPNILPSQRQRSVLDENFDARTVVQAPKPTPTPKQPAKAPEPPKAAAVKSQVKEEPVEKTTVRVPERPPRDEQAVAPKLQSVLEEEENTAIGYEPSEDTQGFDEIAPSRVQIAGEVLRRVTQRVPKLAWALGGLVAIFALYMMFKSPNSPTGAVTVADHETETIEVNGSDLGLPANTTESLLQQFDESFNKTQAQIR